MPTIYHNVGSVPRNEKFTKVGQKNYKERSEEECFRYMKMLERKFNLPSCMTFNFALRGKEKPVKGTAYHHLVLRHETHDERHNRAAEVILNNLPNTWEDTQEFEIDYTNVPDNTGWLTSEESLHYAHTGQLPYRMEKDILIEKEEGILKRAQALALENPSPTDPKSAKTFRGASFSSR